MLGNILSTPVSFIPIEKIHSHLSGFHTYSTDHTRAIEAHHYCSCPSISSTISVNGTVRQCIIYDGKGSDAKLIGIEYVVDEKIFNTLDSEEKKLWHSHKYEVASGLLIAEEKGATSNYDDTTEKATMQALYKTYGKTFHFWSSDIDCLPLGLPKLMMSYTSSNQLSPIEITTRDKNESINTEKKVEFRKAYLDEDYQVAEGADSWEKRGMGIELIIEEKAYKKGLGQCRKVL